MNLAWLQLRQQISSSLSGSAHIGRFRIASESKQLLGNSDSPTSATNRPVSSEFVDEPRYPSELGLESLIYGAHSRGRRIWSGFTASDGIRSALNACNW